MTTERNKTLVRAFVEAVNRRDWQRFDELLAPGIARHSSTSGQPPIRSRNALRDSFPASGRTLTADFFSIYRILDGRIAEAWVEWDCLNGLIRLGHLAPPSAGRAHTA